MLFAFFVASTLAIFIGTHNILDMDDVSGKKSKGNWVTPVVRLPAPNESSVGMRLLLVSDTHDLHAGMPFDLPQADILVHAGDFTCRGSRAEVQNFIAWLLRLLQDDIVHHVVFIAGNHELGLEPGRAKHPVVLKAHEKMRAKLTSIPNVHFLEVFRTSFLTTVLNTPALPYIHIS